MYYYYVYTQKAFLLPRKLKAQHVFNRTMHLATKYHLMLSEDYFYSLKTVLEVINPCG